MLPLALGLLIFLGLHLLPTAPALRRDLIARFGEGPYKLAFAVISLASFALIVAGYHKIQLMPGKDPAVWGPQGAMPWPQLRHLTFLLMLPVFPLLIASQLPGRLRSVIPNPMLLAIKLWALAHFLIRGDAASLLLFGSFLAYAVYDLISVKRRQRAGDVVVRTGPVRNDVIAVVLGLGLYIAFLGWLHPMLIGPQLVHFAP